MKTVKAGFVRLLCVLLFLVGGAAPSRDNAAPSVTDGSSTVNYPSADKPAAAIHIRHAVMGKVKLGEAVLVRITITPAQGATELRIQLTADAGLSIAANDSSFSRRYGAESTPAIHEIAVTPLVEGLHYLTILASMDIDGRTQSRTGAVALQVGPVQQSLLKPEVKNKSREVVISMPAVETTNQPSRATD
jgi:hypothetical protein